jgi:hypothetical protein
MASRIVRMVSACVMKATHLAYGFFSGTTAIPGCLETSPIADARPAASETADAQGTATFDVYVPPGAAGPTVLIQGLDAGACATSNLVVHHFD